MSLESGDLIRRLIRVDFISAQRHIDDDENSRSAKLSRLLHAHYNRYYKSEDVDGYNSIEDALRASAADLTKRYEGAFGRLTARLKSFGYPPGHSSPDLRIKAEMNAETVYRDNTHIYYASTHITLGGEKQHFELPEKYNGLGYKNLIYIVLQLESFRAALEALPADRPRVHIIAIEEPEVHLHPQVQCVFVKEISKALAVGDGSTAQVILSTHSSHMVADSGFDPIRYFRKLGNEVSVRDLSQLRPAEEDALPFLRRYVKLTHCDLFFAGKAILVEGQVERLLLPIMLEKCADREACAHLASEYISISEVGGAYAHKFEPLVDFLGIPTLIITDLDSVTENGKKCAVKDGVRTSNMALKIWLPKKELITDLLDAGSEEKSKGLVCVAYQAREQGYCGRSFEEAFIYSNLDWLAENHSDLFATGGMIEKAAMAGLADNAYEVSLKLPKVDFALDLITLEGWAIPQYISEGLEWLGRHGAA